MSEPSLASIIEGLSSYLAYEKLSGTQSVEVEREVRQALLEEEAVVVPAKEAATGVKANTVVAVEADTAPVVRVDGMEHEPTLLFLREGELAEAVEMEPFEGEQGALLKKMIEAMEVPLARVCVVQVVVMEGGMIEAVRAVLERVKPQATVVLGGNLLGALLGRSVMIGSSRGRWIELWGARAMPTHALEHLLENVEAKREAWQDLQAVMKWVGSF